MPSVVLNADLLFENMCCKAMTTQELKDILMNFGVELEDDFEEEGIRKIKMDIPANRPDLLSAESIGLALKVFMGAPNPPFKVDKPKVTITVDQSVLDVRPYLVCGVLRNITFTKERYDSFIDLQDKLHENLCRRRTLASIGTHDMDSVEAPYTYTAEPPEDIKFVPLMGGEEVDGPTLYKHLSEHIQLSKYLPLLDGLKTWPVIRDAQHRVMSMPPIINSYISRITLDTHNVFIDCTATDLTRAMIAVICLMCAFSVYSTTPFTMEQVHIVSPKGEYDAPVFKDTEFKVPVSYIRELTGLPELESDTIINLLSKMMLTAKADGDTITVIAPPLRSDILHPCDIAEDVAIAYGYKRIQKEKAHHVQTGKPLMINEYCDRLSNEMANCGYTQILNFVLCTKKENFEMLNLEADDKAVTVKSAKAAGIEVARTNLISGMLKATKSILEQPNQKRPLPLKLFEVGDVVLVSDKSETYGLNVRRLCATLADVKTRFADIHGLLDRFFIVNGVDPEKDVKLVRDDCPTCIAGQRAKILVKGNEVGWIGNIHPKVLRNFQLTTPVSGFEVDLGGFAAMRHK